MSDEPADDPTEDTDTDGSTSDSTDDTTTDETADDPTEDTATGGPSDSPTDDTATEGPGDDPTHDAGDGSDGGSAESVVDGSSNRTARSRSGDADRESSTYVESQVIMTTVRVVAPFAFTYGLFLTFHGGGSPGGGFQGGAVVGTTILMIAFAFGIEPTRDWLSNRVVVGLASGGVLAFALIGLLPLLAGGRFLEHAVYSEEWGLYHGKKYALEGVEIVGIAPIVSAIVIGLFFAIAAGFAGNGAAWEGSGPGSYPEDDQGGDAE